MEAPAPDIPDLLRTDDVYGRVVGFARRFGESPTRLAMHAALPIGLTPELVHLLRVNFAPEARWIAEADLLLSPLCREVGGGLFEMEAPVRTFLIDELKTDPDFGPKRVVEVAEFLLEYATRALHATRHPELQDFLVAQQWTALAYARPAEAAEALAASIRDGLMAGNQAEVVRIANLTQALAGPLLTEEKVLLYAAGVERLASGQQRRAERLFEAAGTARVGNVALPASSDVFSIIRPDPHAPPEEYEQEIAGTVDAEDIGEAISSEATVEAETQEESQTTDTFEPVAETDALIVYLICQEGDRRAVEPLYSYLAQRGFSVRLTLFKDDPAEFQEVHEKNLGMCDAVLIYYGAADAKWIEVMVVEVRDAPKRYGRKNTTIPVSGVYVAGPEDAQKALFREADVDVIMRDSGTFRPENLSLFLSQIEAQYREPDTGYEPMVVEIEAPETVIVGDRFGVSCRIAPQPGPETKMAQESLLRSKGVRCLVRLSAPNAAHTIEIEPAEHEVYWEGEPVTVIFEARVTEQMQESVATLAAEVHVGQRVVAIDQCDVRLRRATRTAYVSFARPDLDLVREQIEILRSSEGLVIVNSEEPLEGDPFEDMLHRQIAECDVFILFWSASARDSEWVEREWRLALELKGLDAIRPIALDPLQQAPPPEELASLHFAQPPTESLYLRDLAISEKVNGPDHPDTATALDNLAELYCDQGRYNEAEALYNRSLNIREKVLGSDHPDTATTLNNLAILYSEQGRYDEAEALYNRSLNIREKVLGSDHPDTATTLNNLAILYSEQNRYGEAEALYNRSLAIREKVLGHDHPETKWIQNRLLELRRKR